MNINEGDVVIHSDPYGDSEGIADSAPMRSRNEIKINFTSGPRAGECRWVPIESVRVIDTGDRSKRPGGVGMRPSKLTVPLKELVGNDDGNEEKERDRLAVIQLLTHAREDAYLAFSLSARIYYFVTADDCKNLAIQIDKLISTIPKP